MSVQTPFARSYGVRILKAAVELKVDRRKRYFAPSVCDDGEEVGTLALVGSIPTNARPKRGRVEEFSPASRRRLMFRLLNTSVAFQTMVTLTYAAPLDRKADADDATKARNARIVARAKSDLHRWLHAVRDRIGHYAWVQEFQSRGVIHFHILTERTLSRDAARSSWAAVTDQRSWVAHLFGVKCARISGNDGKVRAYLYRYAGKESQKRLPAGVASAGRFWGTSHALPLEVLAEMRTADKDSIEPLCCGRAVAVSRIMKRWLSSHLPWKYTGGTVFMFRGLTAARALAVFTAAVAFSGST